ncbi:MAG: glycosyltransferase family 4 protein [Coriobacteriia bacterium]|nr:glycosyltransferase family 4 protein [Coriobacteriia bacterium]
MRRLAQVVFNAEGTVGGEQKHVLHLIDGLDRTRFEVEVITWDIPAFADELKARGVPHTSVTAERILDRALLRRLELLIGEGHYDIVHAHGHRAGLLGRLAAVRAGSDHVVWTCHLAENKSERHPIVAWGYRRALGWLDARTDVTVAVSPYLREWLIEHGTDSARCVVIPNGVDTTVFHPGESDPGLLAELGLEPGSPVVGCVARLTEQKGVETFLEAAAQIGARAPGVQFVLVGGGPLDAELRRLAEDLGVNVVFAGERGDIPQLLRVFDVAVVPSRWEGAFCFTVLEAMASGVPVVCSDIRLFSDVVEPGVQAMLFGVGDAEALTRSVMALIDAPDVARAIGQAGRQLVADEYTVDRLRERVSALYEGLVGGEGT